MTNSCAPQGFLFVCFYGSDLGAVAPGSKLAGGRRGVKSAPEGSGVQFQVSLEMTVTGTLSHVLAEKPGGSQGQGCQQMVEIKRSRDSSPLYRLWPTCSALNTALVPEGNKTPAYCLVVQETE